MRCLQRVEIDCDTKWNGDLVRASVTATNGSAAIVDFVANVVLTEELG